MHNTFSIILRPAIIEDRPAISLSKMVSTNQPGATEPSTEVCVETVLIEKTQEQTLNQIIDNWLFALE